MYPITKYVKETYCTVCNLYFSVIPHYLMCFHLFVMDCEKCCPMSLFFSLLKLYIALCAIIACPGFALTSSPKAFSPV